MDCKCAKNYGQPNFYILHFVGIALLSVSTVFLFLNECSSGHQGWIAALNIFLFILILVRSAIRDASYKITETKKQERSAFTLTLYTATGSHALIHVLHSNNSSALILLLLAPVFVLSVVSYSFLFLDREPVCDASGKIHKIRTISKFYFYANYIFDILFYALACVQLILIINSGTITC